MKRILAPALAALTLAACATTPASPEYSAARDIQRLFIAIRDSDRASFERYIDRDALRTQIRGRLLAEASRQGGQATGALATLGALLGGPMVDVATDAAIQPEVFRAIAERRGYRPDMGMPTPDLISRYIRDIGGDAVCVVTGSDDPCLLIFRRQGGTYRLVGYEGDLSQLMPGRRPAA